MTPRKASGLSKRWGMIIGLMLSADQTTGPLTYLTVCPSLGISEYTITADAADSTFEEPHVSPMLPTQCCVWLLHQRKPLRARSGLGRTCRTTIAGAGQRDDPR